MSMTIRILFILYILTQWLLTPTIARWSMARWGCKGHKACALGVLMSSLWPVSWVLWLDAYKWWDQKNEKKEV